MDLQLGARRAVVTGASKGIGLGVARALAAEGVHVLLAARNRDRLAAEADAIARDFGVEARAVAVDLATVDGQASLAEAAIDWDLDILVNNAGAIPGGSITDVDDDTWRTAWDLKVFGYINLTRRLLPHLEQRGAGVVLNVIGAAADRPSPGYIAGAVGNSGLVALSKALGSTSLRRGVRVLAVNPGLIVTDRMSDLLRQQAAERFGDESRWEELIPTDPAPGTVEQVADVVTFLVSDRAGHVSGVVLTVDGGASSR
jgi:NAD(P)-dependent dehydrogenase (short-subunit alcohol dehydrogenase family)